MTYLITNDLVLFFPGEGRFNCHVLGVQKTFLHKQYKQWNGKNICKHIFPSISPISLGVFGASEGGGRSAPPLKTLLELDLCIFQILPINIPKI